MNEVRTIVSLMLGVLLLLSSAVFVIGGSSHVNTQCLRVIARLPVPDDWQVETHKIQPPSGLCRLADYLTTERHHGR